MSDYPGKSDCQCCLALINIAHNSWVVKALITTTDSICHLPLRAPSPRNGTMPFSIHNGRIVT